ncbi:hypothetical protein FDECE_14550 [Fusarium decemcellulare]|nr:hypothetical protein FDECE_14550 [Fusarium decemcellulare]
MLRQLSRLLAVYYVVYPTNASSTADKVSEIGRRTKQMTHAPLRPEPFTLSGHYTLAPGRIWEMARGVGRFCCCWALRGVMWFGGASGMRKRHTGDGGGGGGVAAGAGAGADAAADDVVVDEIKASGPLRS